MQSQQQQQLLKTAKELLEKGLSAPVELRTSTYTRANIIKATEIYKQEIKRHCDEKVAELELQIKQTRQKKKEVFSQVTHHKNKLLRHFQHKVGRANIPASVKEQCWNKWIGTHIGESNCVCCKKNKISKSNFSAGHVISDAMGGQPTVDNLRPICGQCNSSMGTQNMLDFAIKYGFR